MRTEVYVLELSELVIRETSQRWPQCLPSDDRNADMESERVPNAK